MGQFDSGFAVADTWSVVAPSEGRAARPANSWLAAAGCGWLIFGAFLLLLAFIVAGVSIDAFPTVLPWTAGAWLLAAWLLLRPPSRLVAVLSVVGGLLSASVSLISFVTTSQGSQVLNVIIVVASLVIVTLSLIGLRRLRQSSNAAISSQVQT